MNDGDEEYTTQPYLSDELILQIFLRLPVKSLLRFKCVCKSWFSLISDTDFANSHFQITASTHTPKIMFISRSASHETRSLDFQASLLGDDSASVSLNPNFMPFQSSSDIEIKGSCRGFLLLHCYRAPPLYWIYDNHLWNPSTGFHKKIPSSPFASDLDHYYFYGFGYDQSTDDYLMVSMFYDPRFSTNTTPISSRLEIFSLRANMWKQIEGTHIPDTSVINSNAVPKLGLFCSGAINWIVYHEDLTEDVIVAFDLMERKLFEMHLPQGFEGELDYSGLWVFGEFLNLWTMNYNDNAIQIWVMKEYKVDSSWTKTRVLSMDGIPNRHFSPLCSTESGDIIGTGDGKVIKYNDKGQWLDYHHYCNDSRRSQVTLYIESLLSLPDVNAQA